MIALRVCLVLVYTLFLCNEGLSISSSNSCTKLDVYKTTGESLPRSGVELPYCRTSELQCCTAGYLDDLKSEIISEISLSAQSDLMKAFNPWHSSFLKLTESLNEFVVQFIDSYPFPHAVVSSAQPTLDLVKPFLASHLLPTESVDITYNFTTFVSDLTIELVELFVTNVNLPITQKMCLGAILTDEIKTDAITKAGDAMKEIQLIYQSLRKISVFLNNLNVTSFGYLPSEQCVQALLSQRCQQCQTNIPTLCEDICTSLVISCLSPLQDGIQSQIEAVWNVTRQLTLLTQQLMAEILRKHQPSILPPSALPTIAQRAFIECDQLNILNLLGLGRRKKRYVSTIALPPNLEVAMEKVLSLNGLFSFSGLSLPSYCENTSQASDCWNGEDQISNGSVSSDSFLKVNVRDQRENPFYDFNLYQLDQQAASMNDLTSEFLRSSDLNNDLPASIRIPSIVAYDPQIPMPTVASSTIMPSTSTHTTQQQSSASPFETSSAAPRETNNQQKPFDITGSANHIALNSVLITIMSILAVIFIMTHRL